MRTVVTGSIATDCLMVFPGRFTDQLLADHLDRVSLSFLVDDLEIRRGGVAANIAFGLAALGESPVLVGAVGQDFPEYRAWLERHRVDTAFVHVSQNRHTARFLCITDAVNNQIASFYTGAMAESRSIALSAVVSRLSGVDLVMISPDDPEAMLRHTDECRREGYRFAADPSQQLSRMDGPDIRRLVAGATYLFTNEYEAELLLRKTGWSRDEVVRQVGTWVTTHGEQGVTLDRSDGPQVRVPAVPAKELVDPTGAGDAFRAGFLWGQRNRLGPVRSAQTGCTLATIVLETLGGQGYVLERGAFADRSARAYGADAAAEIESTLRIRGE